MAHERQLTLVMDWSGEWNECRRVVVMEAMVVAVMLTRCNMRQRESEYIVKMNQCIKTENIGEHDN